MIITPQITLLSNFQWEVTPLGYQLSFVPESLGDYSVQVDFVPINGATFIEPVPAKLSQTVTVIAPVEEAPILVAPVIITLEEPSVIWFEGSLEHSSISTCTVKVTSLGNIKVTSAFNNYGNWSILLDLSEANENIEIVSVAECGEYTISSDTVTTQIILENAGEDADGDGIIDESDQCPNGYGAADGWLSTPASDQDNDGCHDLQEDLDDDLSLIHI